MKNTWINSQEINSRMNNEEEILSYYHNHDNTKLRKRVKEISKVIIDEFWRPEAFSDSEEYCQHMMHWKSLLEFAIPEQTLSKIVRLYRDGNLFEFTLLAILKDIEHYNKTYTDLFLEGGTMTIEDGWPGNTLVCPCPVCK